MYGTSNGPFGDPIMGSYIPNFYAPPPQFAPSMNYYSNGWPGFYPSPLQPPTNNATTTTAPPPTALYNQHHPIDPQPPQNVFSGNNGTMGGLFNYHIPGTVGGDYDTWISPVRDSSVQQQTPQQGGAGMEIQYSTSHQFLQRMPPPPQQQQQDANSTPGYILYNQPTANGGNHASGLSSNANAANVLQQRPIEHAFSRLMFEPTPIIQQQQPNVDNVGMIGGQIGTPGVVGDGGAANSSVVHALMNGGGAVLQHHQLSLGHQIMTGAAVAQSHHEAVNQYGNGGHVPQHLSHHGGRNAQASVGQQQQQASSKKTWASIVKQPDKTVVGHINKTGGKRLSNSGTAPSNPVTTANASPQQNTSILQIFIFINYGK